MLRIFSLCSGMLTLGSGKSGRCSLQETKTELAKIGLEYDFPSSFMVLREEVKNIFLKLGRVTCR